MASMPVRRPRRPPSRRWLLLIAFFPLCIVSWFLLPQPKLTLAIVSDTITIRSITPVSDVLWELPRQPVPVVIGVEKRQVPLDHDEASLSATLKSMVGIEVDRFCTMDCGDLRKSRSVISRQYPELGLLTRLLLLRHAPRSTPAEIRSISSLGQMPTDGYPIERFQNWLQNNQRAIVIDRPLTVTLINTASVTGLASRYAALLRLHGFDVVAIKDDTQALPRTKVLVDQSSADAETMQRALLPLPLVADIEFQDGITAQYRSDLVLYLGVDAAPAFEMILPRAIQPQTRLLPQSE